jgi:hypothetical protein
VKKRVTPTERVEIASPSLLPAARISPSGEEKAQTWTRTIELAAIARSPSIPCRRGVVEGWKAIRSVVSSCAIGRD